MKKEDVKIYMKEVKILFPALGRKEKDYLRGMEQNLLDYAQDHSEISLDQLYQQFGSPKDVVTEYLNHVDTDYLIKKIKKSTFIKRGICVILVMFLAVCIFKNVLIYKDYRDSMHHRIEKGKTMIK